VNQRLAPGHSSIPWSQAGRSFTPSRTGAHGAAPERVGPSQRGSRPERPAHFAPPGTVRRDQVQPVHL